MFCDRAQHYFKHYFSVYDHAKHQCSFQAVNDKRFKEVLQPFRVTERITERYIRKRISCMIKRKKETVNHALEEIFEGTSYHAVKKVGPL